MSSSGTKPSIGIIVQARLGSTRLPGKIFKELIAGETVLSYLLGRLSACQSADKVIVATTTSSKDDSLARWLKNNGYRFYRGSETDCLDRLHCACEQFAVDIAVRITSDCAFVVPENVDEMIRYYIGNRFEIDYLSNRINTNFPEGLDVEIFTSEMLKHAAAHATLMKEREHINYFFLDRAETYKVRYFNHDLGLDYARFKLSIDTRQDLDQARLLFSEYGLPMHFSFNELTRVLLKYEQTLLSE